jgi:putative transposase
MDETYIKVRGKWVYHYRAVDRDGQTLDFMLSERRDTAAARRFFKRAIRSTGAPDRIAIDKSGANLAGIETAHMIRKGQFGQTGVSPFTQFAALAA